MHCGDAYTHVSRYVCIQGPYNETGHLQVAGQAPLNECNFNEQERRYYLTPNAPFAPSCLMGVPGAFSGKQLGAGLCPLLGVDNVYCQGADCAPLSAECFPGITEFMMTRYWMIFFVLTILLVLALIRFHVARWMHPETVQYPYDRVICSVMPAFILILSFQHVFAFFYGTNYSVKDVALNMEALEGFLPSSVGSFLSVTGVVYGLLSAQVVNIVHEKFVSIRNALSEELASCQQVSVLIKSISTRGASNSFTY
jgi:hypothetical protein